MLGAIALACGAAAGVCVGLMFVVAAIAKYRSRALLPAVIANYRLLPPAAVKPVAMALPWVEGASGLMLLAGISGVGGAAAIALLLVFALAMNLNIRRGRAAIDCGCGLSVLRQPLRRALVIRNVVLAIVLLPVTLGHGGLPLPLHLAAAAAGLSAFVLLILLNALLALPTARQLAA